MVWVLLLAKVATRWQEKSSRRPGAVRLPVRWARRARSQGPGAEPESAGGGSGKAARPGGLSLHPGRGPLRRRRRPAGGRGGGLLSPLTRGTGSWSLGARRGLSQYRGREVWPLPAAEPARTPWRPSALLSPPHPPVCAGGQGPGPFQSLKPRAHLPARVARPEGTCLPPSCTGSAGVCATARRKGRTWMPRCK